MRRTVLERGIKVHHKLLSMPQTIKHSFEENRAYAQNSTNLGLANRCLLGDGIIVPVEEAEEAEDESSSSIDSGKDLNSSALSSSSR